MLLLTKLWTRLEDIEDVVLKARARPRPPLWTLARGATCARSRAVPQRPPPHRHPHTAQARQALRVNTGFSFPYNTISAKSQLPTSCLWFFENSDILSLGWILAGVQRLIFLVEESFYGDGYVAMLPTGQHRWVERDPPTHTSFQLVSTASTILASFIAGLNFVGPAVSFVSNFPCCVSIFSLQPSSIHFNKTILEFRKKNWTHLQLDRYKSSLQLFTLFISQVKTVDPLPFPLAYNFWMLANILTTLRHHRKHS